MNILLYSHTFLPTVGGRELVVYYLARSLKELGHQVRVVGPTNWWHNRKMRLGFSVHRYPSIVRHPPGGDKFLNRLREKELLWQLFFDIKTWGCDIVHAHTTYPTGYIANELKKRLNGFGLVITPHGDDVDTIPELGYGLRLNSTLRARADYALRNADAVTAISEGIQTSLLKIGTSAEKISRIPNGVDVKRFAVQKNTNIRSLLKLPADSRLILTVGNYHPRKGHEALVKSMPEILNVEPRARLVIIGQNTSALNPLIKDLKIEDKIILTGAINFPLKKTVTNRHHSNGHNDQELDKLAAIYSNSEVYVSAGIGEGAEGLSLAVLEGMASGLPIVGTNITGNKDIIENGKNGYLVEPLNQDQLADRLIHILKYHDLRREMGAYAKKIAEKYAWQEVAYKYLDLYKEIKENVTREHF